MRDLAGKAAFVAGALSQIGEASTRLNAIADVYVVLTALRQSLDALTLGDVARSLAHAFGQHPRVPPSRPSPV